MHRNTARLRTSAGQRTEKACSAVPPAATSTDRATDSPAEAISAVEAGRSPWKTESTVRDWRNFYKNPAMIMIMMMDGVINPTVATTAPSGPAVAKPT